MKRAAVHNFSKWLGFLFAALVAAVAIILGIYEEVPGQYILFYGAATFAIVLWGWHHFSVRWVYGADGLALDSVNARRGEDPAPPADEDISAARFARRLVISYKYVVIAVLALLALFLIISFSVENFYTARNVGAAIVLALFLGLAAIVNTTVKDNTSAYVGIIVFIGLFTIGSLIVPGFFSGINVKSMLLFAAFLGLACIGQTLVALLGGLDLSIPYVIGAANVGLLYLMGLGVPSWLAVIIILLLGVAIGVINGLAQLPAAGSGADRDAGRGLCGVGRHADLTSIGTQLRGNVFGTVPDWLTNLAAMNGRTFGLDFPARHRDLDRGSPCC